MQEFSPLVLLKYLVNLEGFLVNFVALQQSAGLPLRTVSQGYQNHALILTGVEVSNFQ